MNEILLQDRIKGEKEIAYLRLAMLGLSGFFVAIQVLSDVSMTLGNFADIVALGIAIIYTVVLFILIRSNGYTRLVGFLSATVDVFLISISIYFTRYGNHSTLASIVSTASFAIYFPVILFSTRRHDPANTLYTGILAGAAYICIIGMMASQGAFYVTMRSPDGVLFITNDVANEMVKVVMLFATGFLGYLGARNHEIVLDRALREQRDKDHIRQMFGKFVSEELIDRILVKGERFAGERREVTVLCIDIKDFTGLADKVPPATLITVLNEFFAVCIRVIAGHGGYIDKFIGDGVLVVFGAPEQEPRHRERAIACAIDLERSLEPMEDRVAVLGLEWKFGFGIGVNSGEAVVGNIGTDEKMEYTALGDTVNTATRLEKLTRELSAPIVVGEKSMCSEFLSRAKGPFEIALKGKKDGLKVYTLDAGE